MILMMDLIVEPLAGVLHRMMLVPAQVINTKHCVARRGAARRGFAWRGAALLGCVSYSLTYATLPYDTRPCHGLKNTSSMF